MSQHEDTTRFMPDVAPGWAVPAAAPDGDPTVTVRPPDTAHEVDGRRGAKAPRSADSGADQSTVIDGSGTVPVVSGSGSGGLRSGSQSATWTDSSSSATRRYSVHGELGAGGMGVVYAAMQGSLGREVAVKVLRDPTDERLRAAFLDEARLAAALDHPGCVPVHDAGADFLVMRLVRGQTFSAWLTEHQPIAAHLAEAIEILIAVTDAVGHAHAHDIVHRDLKPGNILLGGGPGVVMVADWGLAVRIIDGRAVLGATGACVGTPSYLPPEAARGQGQLVGRASDVFLLGAILHRVLSGRPPWPGSAGEAVRAAAAGLRKPLDQLVGDAPTALVTLAERALAEDPAARGDCAGFAANLREWLGRSAADRAAALALAESESELQVAETPATPYARSTAAVHAAVHATERCLATWPEHLRANEVRDLALAAGIRRAVATGDLAVASVLVGRIRAETVQTTSQGLLSQAMAVRSRRQRMLRQSILAGALGIAMTVMALYAAWTWQAQADRRDQARRQAAVGVLLATVQRPPGARTESSPGQEATAAYRALGLVPDSKAALEHAHAATRRALTQALASDDRRLAQAVMERQARLRQSLAQPPDNEFLGQLDAYDEAVRQRAAATVTHWQDDFVRIAGLASAGSKPGELQAAAVPHVAALLASWPGDQVQPVLAGLVASSVPEQRLAACGAALIRPDLMASDLLTPLLQDANADVRAAAWQALARARDVAAWPAMLACLEAMSDPWDARLAAAELGDWGRQRLTAASGLHQRWILGDHRGWHQELATQTELSGKELAAAAIDAWYFLGDAELAQKWLGRLDSIEPKHPESAILRAEIELDRGHPDVAYAHLHALPSDIPQRLPLLIQAAYALQRREELPELGAQLDRVSATIDWGHRQLQVRSALQRALGATDFADAKGLSVKARMEPARAAWLRGDHAIALSMARVGRMRWAGSSAVDQILAGSALASVQDAEGLSAQALSAEALAASRRIAIRLEGMSVVAAFARHQLGQPDEALVELASKTVAGQGDDFTPLIVAARLAGRVAAVHRLLDARIALKLHYRRLDVPHPCLIQVRDLLERGCAGLAIRRISTYEHLDPTLQRDLLDQVLLGAVNLHPQGWPWRPPGRLAKDLLREAALAITCGLPALAHRRLDAAAVICGDPFSRGLLTALRASAANRPEAAELIRRLTLDFPSQVVAESWVYDVNTSVSHDLLRLRPLPDLALDAESLQVLRRLAADWRSTMRPNSGPLLLPPSALAAARALIPSDPLGALDAPVATPPVAWDAWLESMARAP